LSAVLLDEAVYSKIGEGEFEFLEEREKRGKQKEAKSISY